jgi:hypothetical protein
MSDVLLSSEKLLDRLCREEQQMKFLGLHGHAAGIRAAITILIKETRAPEPSPSPSIEPST